MYNFFFGLPLVSFRSMMKIYIFSKKAAFKIKICRFAPWTYMFFTCPEALCKNKNNMGS